MLGSSCFAFAKRTRSLRYSARKWGSLVAAQGHINDGSWMNAHQRDENDGPIMTECNIKPWWDWSYLEAWVILIQLLLESNALGKLLCQ